jgi:hypothetical protein
MSRRCYNRELRGFTYTSVIRFFLMSLGSSPLQPLLGFAFSPYANRIHDAMNTSAIRRYVSASLLHVWVINESKSSTCSLMYLCLWFRYVNRMPFARHLVLRNAVSFRRNLHCRHVHTQMAWLGM